LSPEDVGIKHRPAAQASKRSHSVWHSTPPPIVAAPSTATPVSGLDITIPFALSGTALADEYTLSAESISIPVGSSTGTVTITATEDDDAVELMETIIFNFVSADIVNGTTETTDITLNLESDDNPEITSIAGDPSSFEESASSVITMTINSASSRDVTIPVTISGTATAEIDYITSFLSKGEETLSTNLGQNFNYFEVLEDGRYVLLNGSTLRLFDPETEVTYTISLGSSYDRLRVSGNTIYGVRYNKISTIIVDAAGNLTSETQLVDPTSTSEYINTNAVTVSGSTVYYETYHTSTYVRRV
jgi:hypothetical protein